MPCSDSQQRQSGRRLDFAFMEGGTQTNVTRLARQPLISNASLFSANWLTNEAAQEASYRVRFCAPGSKRWESEILPLDDLASGRDVVSRIEDQRLNV